MCKIDDLAAVGGGLFPRRQCTDKEQAAAAARGVAVTDVPVTISSFDLPILERSLTKVDFLAVVIGVRFESPR
jgi:hypothetical protein